MNYAALLRLRRAALAVLIGSVLTVGAALVLQFGYGYAPCKLCLTERLPYDARPLDLFALGHLDFLAPDFERYPALKMAIASLKAGGNAPVVLNGANEAAVGAFLREQIPFGRIPEIIGRALESVPRAEIRSIADVYAADAAARSAAENAIRRCT